MAEGRMLKKRISKSKKLARLLDDSARLLYLMLLPHTDIEGKLEADPLLIKGEALPLMVDWMPDKIQVCLEKLDAAGLIHLYHANDEQFLQIVKFGDHQVLRTDREGKSRIPDPSHSSSTPGVIQSKVKLSKDKIIKDQPSADSKKSSFCGKPVNNSKMFNEALKKVHSDGFNISQMINRVNKKLKRIEPFPEEVILAVCDEYWKYKDTIKSQWPWFVRVLEAKSAEYYANKNIQEHAEIKKQGPMSLADILKGAS